MSKIRAYTEEDFQQFIAGGCNQSDIEKIKEGEKNIDALLAAEYPDTPLNALPANSFQLSVQEQLDALMGAICEEGWDIPNEVLRRLERTAPPDPVEPLVFRSLRIRFGEGDEGVAQTCAVHVRHIKRVFGDVISPWFEGYGYSLRLYEGNHKHRPVVEWVTADLGALDRKSSAYLADELLVFAWMFPDYVRTLDGWVDKDPIAAGYILDVPERDCGGYYTGRWQHMPRVTWGINVPRLDDVRRDCLGSHRPVPVLRHAVSATP